MTSGIRVVFSIHERTTINTIVNSEKMNVVLQLYHGFHQVVLLSPLKNMKGLSEREFKDIR